MSLVIAKVDGGVLWRRVLTRRLSQRHITQLRLRSEVLSWRARRGFGLTLRKLPESAPAAFGKLTPAYPVVSADHKR